MSTTELKERLRKELAEHAFVTADQRELLDPDGHNFNWFIDVKGIMLKPGMLDLISTLFWKHLKKYDKIQIGGLETVAIALTSGIIMKAQQSGASLNAFYIRKSRKRDGIQRNIEGTLTDEPVILIDDALNSGKSIVRQVEALKAEGKRVVEVCVIITFREDSYYRYFAERGIRVWSLFTLEDFPKTGGLIKAKVRQNPPAHVPYHIEWVFRSSSPRYELVLPKSAPVIDDARVYFGADNGALWALNQHDGSIAWKFQTPFGAGKKRIFSSPALHKGTLFFGAYDGNVYALDSMTGAKKWINFDADWVGSSPCIAEDLNTVFIGLEFGLWRRQGGLAAFDMETGEKKWWRHVGTHVHSSPAYSRKFGIVVVGSRSGEVFAFNAQSGELLWKFSESKDVKSGLAFDEDRGLVIFGSWDDNIYILDAQTGRRVHAVQSYKPIYSSPIVWHGRLYMGLLDKRIVCVDVDSGKIIWQFQTQSRVFATPYIINKSLYCGSNDGRLYELDPETGAERSFLQLTERIVNKIAYNPVTERMFVPTYANELYCVTRSPR